MTISIQHKLFFNFAPLGGGCIPWIFCYKAVYSSTAWLSEPLTCFTPNMFGMQMSLFQTWPLFAICCRPARLFFFQILHFSSLYNIRRKKENFVKDTLSHSSLANMCKSKPYFRTHVKRVTVQPCRAFHKPKKLNSLLLSGKQTYSLQDVFLCAGIWARTGPE